MIISFDLPPEIESCLRSNGASISREARQAYLVELYRTRRITHFQLSKALGLSRYETDDVLKEYEVWLEIDEVDIRAEADSLQKPA